MNAESAIDLRGRAERAILEVLRSNGTERPFSQVVGFIRNTGVDDATIKAAVWRLHSEGRIELTSDWKLKFPRS
jgi:hypothetical protein